MFRTSIVVAALLLFAPTTMASASTACAGACPAIVSVAVTSVDSDGDLNRYHLSGTVENLGSAAQASNTLQSVDIYKGSEKLDAKSIPPLKPGQSYVFSFVSVRSRDAGQGTTKLTFQLDASQPSQDYGAGSHRYSVTF